jgi:hypothetical protein
VIERHESVQSIMKFFSYDHLVNEDLVDISQMCHQLANEMCWDSRLDGPELTVGLRKLLEAKDCFVRAALK